MRLVAPSRSTLFVFLTLDLSAGELTYLCTVPGHEQAGMKGTLTVQ